MTRSREGSVYRRADGRWVASVTVPGPGKRKRVTRYADTEREALTIRRKLLREVDAGRLADDCTVTQWLDHWLEQIAPERASVRTLANYRGHVTHWIAPTIGRQRLSQLRPEDVRRLRRLVETSPKLTRGGKPMTGPDGQPVMHSPTTVRAVMVTLTTALAVAERERRITWNPAGSVDKPKATEEHHAWLTLTQARAVMDASTDPEERARLALALYAGLRQGEALALTWADVDLDARTVRVDKSASRTRAGLVIKAPKTTWSVRTVPLHNVAHATLTAWLPDSTGPYVFGGAAPADPTVDHRRWKAACRRAGVPEVPLHGARATTATLLREAGVPLSTIGAVLGHKPGSPITGLAYAHAQDAELRGAMDALELLP